MEMGCPKPSWAKETFPNNCSFPIPFTFHLGRLGLLKLQRVGSDRLRVCFCESGVDLAAFPSFHLLDISELVHPWIL